MRLWKHASGALKDRNSILKASFRKRTTTQNPDVEAAVIKATSHDESCVDYRNAKRVFDWLRLSPAYLKPFVWALCSRVERTQSWVVVLKSLILVHGVFCCRVQAVHMLGRLPFDLTRFKDGHLSPKESWGLNMFVRVYYSFLDQKSSYLFTDLQERKRSRASLAQDLLRIQKMQTLLDLLMEIKPKGEGMTAVLVLEAMDCVLIEIYDTYSRICDGIAKVLVKIRSDDKAEASVALRVLQKSAAQGEELEEYFDYCKRIRVLNAAECPKVQPVTEEEIRELERIINRDLDEKDIKVVVEDKAIIVVSDEKHNDLKRKLKTVITNKWEVFDEDMVKESGDFGEECGRMTKRQNPFDVPLIPYFHPNVNHQELPDLISFQ